MFLVFKTYLFKELEDFFSFRDDILRTLKCAVSFKISQMEKKNGIGKAKTKETHLQAKAM